MPAFTRLPCFPVVSQAPGLFPATVKKVPLSLRVTRKVPFWFFLTLHLRVLVSVAHLTPHVPLSSTTTSAEKRLWPSFLPLPLPPGSARPAVASTRMPATSKSGMTMRRISDSLLFWGLLASPREDGCATQVALADTFERLAHDTPPRGSGQSLCRSEVAAQRLFPLDRLEEGPEVPLAEANRTVPLDHLEEQSRSVLGRLGEDLEQITLRVTVREDAQPAQVVPVLADLADPIIDVLVVRVGGREEDDAAFLQRLHGADDVVTLERHVLHARTAVELEVLLDLALALALGRLVDRELDLSLAVGHDLRHERRVLRVNLLVGEVDDVRESHRALVELDPVVHPPELDVPDDVVDQLQAHARRRTAVCRCDLLKAGQESSRILLAVDERVHLPAPTRRRAP